MTNRGGRAAVLAVLGLIVVRGASGAPPREAPIAALSDWAYYNRAGWLALDRGRVDRAEQAFRMAVETMRPYQATESVVLARSHADLARVLHQKGRHADAEPLAAWALSVRETTPGDRSESLCQSLELLAEIRTSLRRDADAEPLLKRVIVVREKVVGAGHADLIPAVERLADLYARQGKVAEAESVYRRALSLREANHAESLRQAEERENRAALLRIVIETDGATVGTFVALRRATELQRLESHARSLRESSAESVSAAVTTEHYSALLRRTGRATEADDLAARARAIRDAAETRAARSKAAASR